MSEPRNKRRERGLTAGSAAVVLIGVTLAQFVETKHVDNVLVYALLAIVLTAGGARLDRAILKNLGDKLYGAAGEKGGDDE